MRLSLKKRQGSVLCWNHWWINISEMTDIVGFKMTSFFFVSGHLELVFLVCGVCFHTLTL